MIERRTERRVLRKVGEHVSADILPNLPRRLRRYMGRVYGNAAYRQLHELDHMLYPGKDHGYHKVTPHPDIVRFVAAQGKVIFENIKAAQEAAEIVTQSVPVDVSSHAGAQENSAVDPERAGVLPEVPEDHQPEEERM